MLNVCKKEHYSVPISEELYLLPQEVLADSNTEPIVDDDHDLEW